MELNKLNLIGSCISIFIFITCILIFVFRLLQRPIAEYWTGIAFMLAAIPLIYLFISAPKFERPTLYYIQLGLMIGFIILELFLDYVLKVEFRSIQWAAITYVTLFFASTGGMIGLASHTGKIWTIASVSLFLIMTALAFIQRSITGL